MKHYKTGNVKIALIISLLVGVFVAVLSVYFIGCKPAQVPLSTILKDSTVTVFPGVVQTQDGISYDKKTAERIETMLKDFTTVAVSVSSIEIDMEGTAPEKGYQYDLFQNSLKRFGETVKKQAVETDYALVTDYLISKTPDSGYATGGVHCYVVNQNGEKQYLLLLNSHHKLFQDANLKTNEQTPEGLQHVVDRCTDVIIKAIQLDG